MKGQITDSTWDSTISVPFCIPQTELRSVSGEGDSVLVSALKLSSGQKLKIRWLGLHVPRDFYGSGTLDRLIDEYPAVYCGLYAGEFSNILKPAGRPLLWAGLDGTGYTQANVVYDPAVFSSPDTYTILLINNLKNYTIEASVSGCFRVYT